MGYNYKDKMDVSKDYALFLDETDPLRKFRDRFYIPENIIYFDGNSLGLQSKDAKVSLLRVIDEWKNLGIKGWLNAEIPWFEFAETMGKRISPIVGAKSTEVIMTGTTTINLHSVISTFYNPSGSKTKILADELNFPSDIYAIQSQIELKGLDSKKNLILVPSLDGKTLNHDTIIEMMTDEIAMIILPSVLYRSGQLLDMALLTRHAHLKNILIGFDCSHSVGAVPHYFDEWGVDFALWCGYKYLNGGPGAPAFIYINEKHFNAKCGLRGWFGFVKSKQFDMSLDFEQAPSAGGWQISSPGIIASSGVEGALKITLEAGILNIRQKSIKMTEYLVFLIKEILSKPPYNFLIGTPLNPKKRSGHIALERAEDAWRINQSLIEKGFIPDFRPPNIIRIAPIALYNEYIEIWRLVQEIKGIIDSKSYLSLSNERSIIS